MDDKTLLGLIILITFLVGFINLLFQIRYIVRYIYGAELVERSILSKSRRRDFTIIPRPEAPCR